MDKLRFLIVLLAFSLSLGMSAQSRKTTGKKTTTTAKTASKSTAKKSTAKKPATTSTSKKSTTTTTKKAPATTAKPVTTTTAPSASNSSAKQEYKEGYNEGFEAGLRAAQRNGASTNNTPANTNNSNTDKVSGSSNVFSGVKSSLSQKPAESKNAMFAEFQAIFDVNGGPVANHLYEIDFGYLRKVSENFRLGFGLGFRGDFRFNSSPHETLPVFLRGQVNVPTMTDITPFLNLDLGYVLSSDFEDLDFEKCPIRLNPSVGAYFGQVYAAVGYLGEILPVSEAKFVNYVNLKLGVKMGDRPKSYKVFKSSYLTLEAAAGPTFQTAYYEYDYNHDEDKKTRVTLNGGLDFHWMFPLGDHVAIGPGIGAYHVTTSTFYRGSEDDPEYNSDQTIYVPLTVRAEGTFLDKNAAIRPYAAADLGVVLGNAELSSGEVTFKSPTFEIQGGIKLNNKVRVGAGLKFNGIGFDEDYDKKKHDGQTLTSFNAHVGIDF